MGDDNSTTAWRWKPFQVRTFWRRYWKELGDKQSQRFYHLVAAKIPEGVIRETLAEVRVDGARDPARLFTYKMQRYALTRQKS